MGKKGGEKRWVDYYISQQLGFCHGPVDSLVEVLMKEKPIHQGEVTANTHFDVNLPDLFGGDEREGGAVGRVHVMLGTEDQLIPAELAARKGLTPETAPGYRGIVNLVFVGNKDTGGGGFLVSQNYPTVPAVWGRFRRSSKGLGGGNAIIPYYPPRGSEDDATYNRMVRHDSNPSHMLFEVLTNSVWGMGGSPNQLDRQSFFTAAQTLADEQFGLSMKWTREATIETFAQEILDHIQGVFFYNPRTGLGTLKLLRDDYDVDTLDILGPSNSELVSFRRKLWGETANEVSVSWTNPETEQEEKVTYQDLGNIAMQGEVVHEGRNYYGVRNAPLAGRIAARDIVSISQPLASGKVRVDRRQWKKLPGDVVKLSWPSRGIETVVMRIMEIDYGKPTDSAITLTLMEDVYGLPSAEFIMPPKSEWEDPAQNADDEAMQLPVMFVAVPYPIISRAFGNVINDDLYPGIIVAALATPTPEQTDVMSFRFHGEGTMPNGEFEWQELGEKNTVALTRPGVAMPPEPHSTIEITDWRGGEGPAVGSLGLLSYDGMDEDMMEIIMFDEDLGDGRWRVARGMIDTIPRQWVASTPLRILGPSFNAIDGVDRIADEPLRYKLRPRTSLGVMSLDRAQEHTTSHVARPYMPFRPANVRVGVTTFGTEDHSQDTNPRVWQIEITWSNRNRLLEDAVFRRWDEPDLIPEAGQTTTIIINPGENEQRIKGLTGNSYTMNVEDTGQMTVMSLKLISERDGFESFTGHTVTLRLFEKGYGRDWSYFYGGWPAETPWAEGESE